MEGIPPLPKCQSCGAVQYPDSRFDYVSCGHLLCDQCSQQTEGHCPSGDEGIAFVVDAEKQRILKRVLMDIHRMHGETLERFSQLAAMNGQLRSIISGKDVEMPPAIATCANCNAAIGGARCQFCGYKDVCRQCGGSIDEVSKMCTDCEQGKCTCPMCGDKVAIEDMFEGHKGEHLRYIVEYRKDSSAQVQKMKTQHYQYLDAGERIAEQVHPDLGNQIEDLLMHHRESVDKNTAIVDPILHSLESEIQSIYTCKLAKYGSGANGFTMIQSDFDITVLLANMNEVYKFPAVAERMKAEKEADFKKFVSQVVLNNIANVFVRNGFRLEDRLSARTPILKCDRDRLELDISVGNEVAVHNSALLNTYALLDERVRAAGIALKHWAKNRGIADASIGYLSSYSYLVLLIAYLQRTSPPLIPNLQEDYPPNKPRVMVESFDCSFETDTSKYSQMCRDNPASLVELLTGFFRYYGFTFNWQTQCVTIRRSAGVTKLEKGWTRNEIAIEDPFEVKRNLGDVSCT